MLRVGDSLRLESTIENMAAVVARSNVEITALDGDGGGVRSRVLARNQWLTGYEDEVIVRGSTTDRAWPGSIYGHGRRSGRGKGAVFGSAALATIVPLCWPSLRTLVIVVPTKLLLWTSNPLP